MTEPIVQPQHHELEPNASGQPEVQLRQAWVERDTNLSVPYKQAKDEGANICRRCEIVIPSPATICTPCHQYPHRQAGKCVNCGATAPDDVALCWVCAGEGQLPFPLG